jgi:hypothetical protein
MQTCEKYHGAKLGYDTVLEGKCQNRGASNFSYNLMLKFESSEKRIHMNWFESISSLPSLFSLCWLIVCRFWMKYSVGRVLPCSPQPHQTKIGKKKSIFRKQEKLLFNTSKTLVQSK